MGNSIIKVAVGIIAIIVAYVMFPLILTSTNDLRMEETTDTGLSAHTAVGVTSATVTLTEPLLGESVLNVGSITTSVGGDVPVASTYNDTTQGLTITGLLANNSRTATILYDADSLNDYEGMADMVNIAPFIIFMSIIIAAIGTFWHSFRNRNA